MTMITTLVKKISTEISLIEKIKEAPDTYTFKFSVPDNIKWEAGAYAHFLCSDLQQGKKMKKELVRELSIMSHPNDGYLGFTTRIRQNPSEFKATLLHLKVGEDIRMFKIGNNFKKRSIDKPLVFISMGVGIATFRPLIHDYLMNASMTFGISNINIDRSGEFVYQKEFEALAGELLINRFAQSREALYQAIDKCIETKDRRYFVVGSDEFNAAIRDYLIQKSVPKNDIVFDKH